MFDVFAIKNSYCQSLIIVLVIVIAIVVCYHYFEKFIDVEIDDDDNLEDIELKTQQCKDCQLIGKKENSYEAIYKKSKE